MRGLTSVLASVRDVSGGVRGVLSRASLGGRSNTYDVIDASVALLARRHAAKVVTSGSYFVAACAPGANNTVLQSDVALQLPTGSTAGLILELHSSGCEAITACEVIAAPRLRAYFAAGQ